MSTTTFNLIGINGPSGFLASSGNTWMQAYVTGSPLTKYDLTTTSSFGIVDGSFSGRIYLLAGTGTAPDYTAETDIIPGAVAGNQRFAVYELNLGNSPSDVLDITAENGLGFNLSAESVTSTSGSYFTGAAVPFSVGTTGLAQQVAAVNSSAVISSGAYDMMFGASGAPGSGYWPSTDWTTYITSVRTTGSVINSMAFGGVYGIPTGSSTNPNYEQIYNYRAYSTSYGDQTGTMLYPVALNVNMPTGWIQATDWVFVPDATLQANVYQPGAGDVYITTFSNGQLQNPTQQLLSTTPPYNSTALMMTSLVAGFDAGFYGSFGTNANPLVFDKLDLNKSWNANWNYAYQGYLMEGITPGNGTSLGSSSVGSVFNNGNATVLGGGYYDAYAAIVSKNTNVYAWPYSDYLSKWGGTPPIIPLYDGATSANVATVNLTVYGDSTVQPATNFLAPSANYLANYSGVNAASGSSIQFNMTYGSYNNGGTIEYVTPDQNTSLTFRIYAAGQGLPNTDSQGFLNFNLNGLYTSGGNFSNWTNFVFSQDATTQAWSVASNGAASAATPGFVNLQNVPVVQSGTAWYQLILGNGAHASTYNIYSVANASGQFTQMVADHSITPTSGVNIPGFSPPTVAPLSAPNSTPTTSALIGLAGNYITFDVATFEAPRFSRFADGPLANDTLLINANTGQIANWQLNESGQVIAGSGLLSATLLPGWQVAATGSFAAGTHDVLLANVTATGTTQLATWTVNGTTVTPNPLVSAELGVGWSILGIGAFTGGLDNQILLQNFDHATGTQQLAYWQLDNAGQITAGGNIGGPLGNGWTVVGTGNLLGNGRTDVLLQNGTNLAIWELNDSGQLAQAANINQQLTPGWEVVGLGNFFSTSPDQDILLKNGNQVAMWQLNGFDVGQQGLVSTLLPGWAIAGVGDYNTDGVSDILLQNGNQFAEWMMNGMTVSSTAQVGSQLSTGWNLLGTGNL